MTSTPASLESVLNTAELNGRPSRSPDYESENRALLALAQHLADSPRTILQKLAEIAMEVCRAGSAGVSLISKETGDFYWPAIAGALKTQIGGGTPRNFGPCGTVLDRNAMQLFTHPERYFPYLAPLTPPIEEVLLTPFYIEGKAVGTVWVITHDATRKFDAEDVRQIESLGRFAAAAHQVRAALDAQIQQAGAMRDVNQSLLVSSVRQHELTEQAETAEAAAAHEITERKRVESLIQCQKQSLELLVKGEPIEQVLDFLARSMESQSQGKLLVAIHLMEADGHHFGYVAAPSLPASYALASRGMDARLDLGPCSSAVMAHKPTVVRDFVTEARWPAFTAEVLSLGLRGCFTTPIVSPPPEQRILGTFAIYYREPRDPSPHDQQLVDLMTHTLALAIDRKQAEHALRENEERFRTLADNISQFAWTADAKGWIYWYNQRWYDYTGTTLEEMRGWGWKKVHHPDHVDRVVERIQRSWDSGEPWEDTFPLRGKDGNYRWFLSRARAIRDAGGNVVSWFGTNTDVTEVRDAEKELHVSEIRYRRLFEAAHDGILILDAQTARVVEVNRYMLDLLRQPREYFLGKELWELGVLHDKQQNQEAMRQLHRDRLVRYEDLQLKDRDGRRVPVEFVSNIYQEDHQPIIQCNIRDISERKRFQDEREAHLINEQSLRMEAEGANRSKDMFLATLSHEMRTPLNAIVGWVSILRNGTCDDADLQEGLDVIDRNTKAQVQLIEDVLDVSRIVSGKLRLEIRPCDLMEVIKAGIDVVRPAAEARSISLDVRLEASAGRAMCDGMRIQQVVWNLVSNAVKFTPKGGTVRVALTRDHSSWRIQVSDNGQGIPPDLLPYVFDRFRQADSGTRRKFGGLGLGLSIVKHLVEMHGGTVQAVSGGADNGAAFTVRLPIRAVRIDESGEVTDGAVAGTDAEDEVISDLPIVRLDGLRVLVVDDEADARRLLVKLLEGAGALVTAVASAAEAMAVLPKTHPAVLVSDIGMPGEDGFDLIRQVRRGGQNAKDLPAVALTAFVHKDEQRQALLAGFQVHVPKPVDPHDLTAVIASLAGRTG